MDSDQALGETIRNLRQALNMSHAALAQEMTDAGLPGIYPQTLVKIEQGKRMLRYREGVVIADIFGLDGHELLVGEDVAGADRDLMRQLRSLQDASMRLSTAVEDLRARYLALVEFAGEAHLTESGRATALANVRTYGPEKSLRLAANLLEEVPPLQFNLGHDAVSEEPT